MQARSPPRGELILQGNDNADSSVSKGRQGAQSFGIMSLNGGGWGPFLGYLRDARSTIVCGQATRLPTSEFADSLAGLNHNDKVRAYGAACNASDKLGKSGGTIVVVPN